ncbi:uncharacterized protein LOC118437162 [Folsomia candida]|uniref:Uncharacterized protein n=1 Tax=Folsomia candida TaxID=158441 RepID=A0A226DUS6_FOLCA|nr:uncharacterized protein LOC118437162 [Folsomia candida]XP_035711889.1 uncharacterized protein LOC118437162 [Folsomia candida]OXA47976.1 hypothetical protein Fcan01_17297 [Folsomia candida]
MSAFPTPPPKWSENDIKINVLKVVLVTFIVLHYFRPMQPEVRISSDGVTWNATHWAGYNASSPPNNSTQVSISMIQVEANITKGKELSLNFVLVQEWDDPRFVIRSKSGARGPTSMNIEEIKGPDGDSVTIWKPSIRTHPTHEGEKTRDETRLWKGGKLIRFQPLSIILPSWSDNEDGVELDYMVKLCPTLELLDGVVLDWNAPNGRAPISMINEDHEIGAVMQVKAKKQNWRMSVKTGQCETGDSALKKRSCLAARFKLSEIPLRNRRTELNTIIFAALLSLSLCVLFINNFNFSRVSWIIKM